MSVALSMICLGKGAKLSPTSVQQDMRENWPDLPEMTKPEKAEEKEKAVVFNVGEAMVALMVVPAPIPWGDLEGPCSTSMLFPDAEEQLKDHKGHVIVSVLGELEPIESITLLTQVTASIVGTADGVLGIYWGAATIVVPPDLFRKFAIEIMAEVPPLHIWVDTRVGPNDEGSISGFTMGLSSLGLMELETVNASEDPEELRERFHNLAYYLLENGLVIDDGDTIGGDAQERIQVNYSESAFGLEGQVMRLDFAPAKKKKKGWFR